MLSKYLNRDDDFFEFLNNLDEPFQFLSILIALGDYTYSLQNNIPYI